MEAIMSHDYRFLVGKISMNLPFAEKFFAAPDSVLAEYNLTSSEILKLKGLSAERFRTYMDAIILRSCDCDSCCNGGEGKGNCSECFANCCQ